MMGTGSLSRQGLYSPNQCLFFVVLVLILLIPFLGKRLSHPAQTIENLSLKTIYLALVHPLITAAEDLPAAALIPSIRSKFIEKAGLAERGEWDSFFYLGDLYGGAFDIMRQFEDEQNYSRSLDRYAGSPTAPDTDAGERLPTELHGHISPQLLRDVSFSMPHSARYPLRMFFFGDSQMHGIAAGMMRALGSDTSITIEKLSVHSSGFLRSDYYNWPQKLETLFAQQKTGTHFDAAVLFLGMNDYQDMATASGAILTAGTPEWETVYRKMVKTHLDTVLRSVPRLYWLGLPAVRKTAYNEKIQYLDSVHCSIAEEYDPKQVIKVSLKDWVTDYGSSYVSTVRAEDGTWFPFMESDGIHYTIEGGEYLMKKFIMQLHDDYEFETVPFIHH